MTHGEANYLGSALMLVGCVSVWVRQDLLSFIPVILGACLVIGARFEWDI